VRSCSAIPRRCRCVITAKLGMHLLTPISI
jgi:hypothetical protein